MNPSSKHWEARNNLFLSFQAFAHSNTSHFTFCAITCEASERSCEDESFESEKEPNGGKKRKRKQREKRRMKENRSR